MSLKAELEAVASRVGTLEAALITTQAELDATLAELAECLETDPPPPPPPPPPDPTDEYPIPFDGLELNPSTFTQTKVSQLGADARIVLAEGLYKGATVTLSPGQHVYGYGPDKSVFDGENVRGEALKPASGVVIAHLGFTRYKGSGEAGMAPIAQNGAAGVVLYHTDHWRNHKAGIRTLGSWVVKRNRSWENGQYGAAGNHPAVLETYEWWRNGRGDIPGVPAHPDSNKGGSKFTKSTGGSDRYGKVYDNVGMGWWADIGNAGIVVEYLETWGNEKHGIISEANLGPMTFRYCNSHDNGPQIPSSPSKNRWAQIFIALTPNTRVENCTAKGRVGITGYQWNHKQIAELNKYGDKIALKNLLVTGCTIDAEIAAGIEWFASPLPDPLTANNLWTGNTYLGDPKFVWQKGDPGVLLSETQWSALGMS